MAQGDVLGVDAWTGDTVRIRVDMGVARIATIVVPRWVYLSADWESFGHQLARRQLAQQDRLEGRST